MSKHNFVDIRIPIETDNPSIMRDENSCIKCGNCRRVCENDIAVGRLYNLSSTGDKPICINCGQCANVCPVDSITEKYEYLDVKKAIQDPEKIVVFSTSPSVRASIGESFGFEGGTFLQGKMVAALRTLGADYVLDTNFAADLTIMEEASELVDRILNKNELLPQFTSCCPAWVKFVETFYPDMIPNISSAKSPIGMQGPTIKTYFAKSNNINPKNIINVALTPCTAKKFEIRRDEMNAASKELGIENMRDMDYVITTRELTKWLKEENINFSELADSEYDDLMGNASGAGVIFGNTGGVMEAAIRTAYFLITGDNPPEDYLTFNPLRGMDGIRVCDITINNIALKLAVVHGTDNAKILIDDLKSGAQKYDFIEVMTCRGGCIGGGGQPKTSTEDDILKARIKALYTKDKNMKIRSSYSNPHIKKVYTEYYIKPLSAIAHKLLHTTYYNRYSDLGPMGMIDNPKNK